MKSLKLATSRGPVLVVALPFSKEPEPNCVLLAADF